MAKSPARSSTSVPTSSRRTATSCTSSRQPVHSAAAGIPGSTRTGSRCCRSRKTRRRSSSTRSGSTTSSSARWSSFVRSISRSSSADCDEIRKTMDAIQERLIVKTSVGGVARYENDYYHQVSHDIQNVAGNPWFICVCWLAEYFISRAQTEDELHQALAPLQWVRDHALPSGLLADQVDPYTDAPLSVSPLTWSPAA